MVLVSLPIPCLGRTAIGWIVDATTIGSTIIFGFVSAAAFKASKQKGKKKDRYISGICLVILAVFLVFLLFPGLFSDHTIETETYVLMTVWSLFGLLFFHWVIRKDYARNFGKAIIVWIALLAFIVLVTMTWVERVNEASEDAVMGEIQRYADGTADRETLDMDKEGFFQIQRERLHAANNTSVTIISGLFGLSLIVLLSNYLSMQKWEKKTTEERDQARTAASTDPLTGVKSKYAFSVQEGKMEELVASGEAGQFGVVICDVNGLKKINDTLGHKAGDEYVRSACVMLCEFFKHSPVFRIGGDEFVVLLQGRDFEARHEILKDINAKIEGNIHTNQVVASLGLADFEPGTDASFHEVFKRADGRMYERKTQLKGMGAVTRE